MKFHSFLKLLSSAIFPLCITPALAEMTADQHYERGRQENTDAKYLEAIADFDAAIKMQPDYWKAYANRSAAEYNAKRYQAALNDLNTAIPHLPPGKGLTDLKAMIERAMQPAPSSADISRQIAAVQALNRLTAISAGGAYPGQFNGQAYGISQLANTLMSHGYKIPSNLVHPITTPLIHPMGEPSAPASQPAAPQASTSTSKIAVAADTPPQAHPSENDAKLASLIGGSNDAPNYLDQGAEKGRAGDWAGAIANFDECIKQDPNNFSAYANRGAAKLQTGDTQGAIVDLERAVQLMPDNPNTKSFRDRLKEAIEQAKQSVNTGH